VFGAEKRELGPLQQEVRQTLKKTKVFNFFFKWKSQEIDIEGTVL
jgi:hypothetical protein